MTIGKSVVRVGSLAGWLALSHCNATPDSRPESIGRVEAEINGGYVGCFTDDENRALPVYLGNNYTIERCVNDARARGLPYAGLQYYGECWGGTSPGYVRVAESECNTYCTASQPGTQICGGAWRNSIWSSASPVFARYVGCYTDAEQRALPVFIGGGHDVASCVHAAYEGNFKYAGLQWYGECWGGNTLGYEHVDDAACNTPCSSTPWQTCGGGWHNSVYQLLD
jgi:hypothetical protein